MISALKEALAKASLEICPGYSVTSDGRVISEHSNWRGYGERELRQHQNQHGYLYVRMRREDGRRPNAMVHVLVAIAFHGPRPSPKHQVRHLDGDKLNNSADNLAWGTAQENAADRTAHGRCKAAENGRRGAAKLRKTHCVHGHKFGRARPDGYNRCDVCTKEGSQRLTEKRRAKARARLGEK